MTKTIRPETITKIQAVALESVKALPEFSNTDNILHAHMTDPKGWGAEYAELNDMDYRQLKRVLKYGYTTHVQVKRIVITRGEGPSAECGKPRLAKTWEEANEILKRMALTAPKQGYDKTDFEILFTNGDIYNGRYDLTQEDRISGNLYEHVKGHCEFYGGICKRLPDHITPEQYTQIIGEYTVMYLQLLDNVIYPSANEKGLDPELLQSLPVMTANPPKKRYLAPLESNFTLMKLSPELSKDDNPYIVYSGGSRHTSFKTPEGLERWMKNFGLRLGEEIQANTYKIHGAYRVSMIGNRAEVLHLPQIVIKMNCCMVRAYKEVTPESTNIYVVSNYIEKFNFDYSTPKGLWYLKKFFWN
ncbi:LPD25 domain-containing protein [Paenibacillus prosopidis]|uniref:Large polyvalent protein associated domain-containing protein n=1 Tax=Paenibacillus prosopidis TaxID=630520 RepID=A0A368VJA3_9BACL|nr:LPD25 domain-containing protein [Paenibacillus prosopidis]RCW41605.1 hypothetical protein DFP97_12241 [Paenibacillus prosopidis]